MARRRATSKDVRFYLREVYDKDLSKREVVRRVLGKLHTSGILSHHKEVEREYDDRSLFL